MKKLYNTFVIVFASATACPSFAQEGNPAFWLAMPFAQAVSGCAVYGPKMRQRLTDALATGRENSKEKLPESIWTLLGSVNSSTENKESSPAVTKTCDGVVDLFRHPQFATQFRQVVVAQLVTTPAVQCIIEQPTVGEEVKRALLSAFVRNGLELTESSMNEGIESARSYIKSGKPGTGPSVSDCKELATMFSTQEFDAKYGEKGIYDLFSKY